MITKNTKLRTKTLKRCRERRRIYQERIGQKRITDLQSSVQMGFQCFETLIHSKSSTFCQKEEIRVRKDWKVNNVCTLRLDGTYKNLSYLLTSLVFGIYKCLKDDTPCVCVTWDLGGPIYSRHPKLRSFLSCTSVLPRGRTLKTTKHSCSHINDLNSFSPYFPSQ